MPEGAAGPSAVAHTRAWVELAVIGLDLCPFARTPHDRQRVRYRLSEAADEDGLLQDLCAELDLLAAADPAEVETTLLIHPHAMTDFLAYNDFLEAADGAVSALGYEGVLQVASFHPQYQFAGTEPDDVTNASNRSPYPTLHLLREASVERAVLALGDTEEIFRRNIRTLQTLGPAGWARLQAAILAGGKAAG